MLFRSLINNVDVCVEHDPERIRLALVRQAAAPVRWAETMQKFLDLGITHVIECGPGKVLAGLAKRCQPDIPCFALSDRNAIETAIAALRND